MQNEEKNEDPSTFFMYNKQIPVRIEKYLYAAHNSFGFFIGLLMKTIYFDGQLMPPSVTLKLVENLKY
jgi:hypothetical protein